MLRIQQLCHQLSSLYSEQSSMMYLALWRYDIFITVFCIMLLSLTKRDSLFLGILGLFVLISRIVGAETSPLLWDAGSFHLAATEYDITQDRPHLPGYFLHVQIIRVFRLFLNNHAANVAPSVLWSLIGILLLYLLARHFTNERTSFLTALLMATNPMLWFFGSVSEIYAFDFFFSVALFFCGTRGNWIYGTPLLMAFAAGVRQSSPVLLLPLYCWLWYCAFRDKSRNKPISWKAFFLWHGIALIAILAWLLPMMHICGGWQAYRQLYQTHNPMLKASPLQNIVVMASYMLYTLPAFIVLLIAALLRKNRQEQSSLFTAHHRMSFALWIGVPLVFFILVLYGKGYALIWLASLPLLFIPILQRLTSALISGVLVLQCVVYLAVPYKFPDVQIWFQGGSALQKAAERTTSVYSLTQSHINTVHDFQIQLDSALQAHTAAYIFIDPTFPVSPRALQVRHPQLRFASLLVRDGGLVQIYEGINLRHSNNLQGILDSSLVLTTRQCHALYFNNTLLTPQWQQGELLLCKPRPSFAFDNAETVDMMYQRLFVH